MRQWLFVSWVVVLVLAIVTVVSFVRAKHNDQPYRTTLAAYRAALSPGSRRDQVEDYLRGKGMTYERTCCAVGIYSDRTKIGEQAPHWFCAKQDVYLDFKFDNATPSEDVAQGSDILKKIDLYQSRSCW
jgi:hypothetical protein